MSDCFPSKHNFLSEEIFTIALISCCNGSELFLVWSGFDVEKFDVDLYALDIVRRKCTSSLVRSVSAKKNLLYLWFSLYLDLQFLVT